MIDLRKKIGDVVLVPYREIIGITSTCVLRLGYHIGLVFAYESIIVGFFKKK